MTTRGFRGRAGRDEERGKHPGRRESVAFFRGTQWRNGERFYKEKNMRLQNRSFLDNGATRNFLRGSRRFTACTLNGCGSEFSVMTLRTERTLGGRINGRGTKPNPQTSEEGGCWTILLLSSSSSLGDDMEGNSHLPGPPIHTPAIEHTLHSSEPVSSS